MKLNKCFSVLWWLFPRAAGLVVFVLGAAVAVGQPLTVISTSTNAGTCGAANGSISVVATGGVGAYQYSIDGEVTWQSSNIFSGLAGGAYTIFVEDAAVPPNMTSVGVALGNIPGPTIGWSSNPASCLNNDGELDIMPVGGTPPYEYSTDGVNFQAGNLIGGLKSGNVFVTVLDNNGCSVGQLVNIPLVNNETLTAAPGPTVCQGVPVPLSLTTNATQFSWSPTVGLDNPGIQNPVATPAVTTTYTVTAVLGVCSMPAPVTVTIMPAPVPTATPTALICFGQSTQLVGSGGVTYQWSPATYLSSTTIPNPVVQSPQHSITYSLNVTGANGCTSVQPALSLVVVTPPPKVFAGDDTAILIGQTLPLNAQDLNNSGFSSYQWSPAFGLDNPSIQDPVATITADITYVVTATTPAGCTGMDSIKILAVTASDLVVPNAFTPNGDGHNDVLRVHAIGIKDFKFFRVFSRWGQEVFVGANESAGWDGTIGGTVQPMGTYVWVAVGLDFGGKLVERRGTVILVR
jgi:gliding motility-associated-like protein